jgi:hypothetical protein
LRTGYEEALYQEFGKEMSPIELDMSFVNPTDSDITNAKIVYEKLKFLTDSQASQERLWAALCHDMFWDYMQYRWPLSASKRSKVNYVLDHYFFSSSSRGKYFNGLSRLWWLGRLTYDSSRENPYEVLEYLGRDISGRFYPLFAGHIYSNNPTVFREFMDGIFMYEQEIGKYMGREQFKYLMKKVDLLGGGIQLDYLADVGLLKEEVRRLLYDFR